MKLQIQTLTGQVRKVEAEPQYTVLDLKVSDTVKRKGGVDPDINRTCRTGGDRPTEFSM